MPGMRTKGDPLTYYVQKLTVYPEQEMYEEWETVSSSPIRKSAIEEAKRLSLELNDKFRVVVMLVQFQTETP